ncbi:GTPase ObgE [Paenibacillus sp. GCM10023248]|uniref:GTPase ObgE n=1 Tax=Bacillales TaxID=1385 RepID=UPI0023789B06|nr:MULTISPECIES: GTPase ObgE [Bacillales]MDD9269851.1 GTPase ObgE [Paenibacillus sp. MAHUQ-63]MDR6884963.1 GTP-binding protein [Bacillus sp. 3255]
MFVDKAKVFVKGGDGGDGLVAFRREKYVPEGGPAGGDGGNGGDVIFRVDEGLRTLMDFRYQKHFKAARGEKGRNKSMHGANAEDMIVRIPPGTTIINDDTQEIIADLTRHGQEVVVAKGGRGGRGNTRFVTQRITAPEIAENGEEGEERWVVLEMKVMADVGLVGFPSVGKSTLLSVVSAAKPKIAAYHFTTLTPNLGVVDVGDGRSFVMADLPGLIEGAHEGVGLGHEFLRHVERTRVIVHVVDMSAADGRDPYEDFLKINEEVRLYNAKLEQRPQIVVANKMDMPQSEENLALFKEQLAAAGSEYEVYPISALTREGVQELLYKISDIVESIPQAPEVEAVAETEERKVYRYEKREENDYTIRRVNDVFVVESPSIEKLIKRTNFSTQDGVARFARILRNMGIDQELRNRGAVHGQTIQIGDFDFEFDEKQ